MFSPGLSCGKAASANKVDVAKKNRAKQDCVYVGLYENDKNIKSILIQ